MSYVRTLTINGDEVVEVYIGPEHESFGICYECRDERPRHNHCVGVPCECPCPIPAAKALEAGI